MEERRRCADIASGVACAWVLLAFCDYRTCWRLFIRCI
jgi:hypothetical protein